MNRNMLGVPGPLSRGRNLVSWICVVLVLGLLTPFGITGLNPSLNTWTQVGIGADASGSVSQSGGQVTINGSGRRIGSRVDSFYYVGRPVPVGGEVRVKLNTLGQAENAGVMVRSMMSPDSPNVFLGVSAQNSTPYLSWRTIKRGETQTLNFSAFVAEGLSDTSWLKLIPEQSTVYAYFSNDGTTWIPLAAVELTMPASVFAGVAVASGDAVQDQAVFDEVGYTPIAGYRVELTQKTADSGVAVNGSWNSVTAPANEFAFDGDYLSDGGGDASSKTPSDVVFTAPIAVTGHYEVYIHYSPGADRADEVPIDIAYFDEATVIANYGSGGGGGGGQDPGEFQYSNYWMEYNGDWEITYQVDYYMNAEYAWESHYNWNTGEYWETSSWTYYSGGGGGGGGDPALSTS
ncbi:MAG: hypothetical protein AAF585_04355, partial [Verrucomicrobiota bacterium]